MKFKAELLTVDFKQNTITFEVNEDFFDKYDVVGGNHKSEIESQNFITKLTNKDKGE
jgi:hypothetical protein